MTLHTLAALQSAVLNEKDTGARPGTIRQWKQGSVVKLRDGTWAPVPKKQQPAMRVVPASTPMPTVPKTDAPAEHPSGGEGGEHSGGPVKKALGHLWHMASDPFVKGHKLATSKEYRGEIKDWLHGVGKKELKQHKGMMASLGKVVKGEKLTKEEKSAMVDQIADTVKMAAGVVLAAHFAEGGLANLAALLSPADEMVGIALDKPLRAITKALLGREHGLLPTSFYESAQTADDLLDSLVDAVLDELAKHPPSDEDIEAALKASGVDPSKPETMAAFKPKGEAKDVEDQALLGADLGSVSKLLAVIADRAERLKK